MPKPELMNLFWTTAGMFPGRGDYLAYRTTIAQFA